MQTEMLPIPRTTLTEMCVAYRQSEHEIRAAYAMLIAAEERLRTAFQSESYDFSLDRRERCDYRNPEGTMSELKKSAWQILVNKMGIKSTMSLKRAEELEKPV